MSLEIIKFVNCIIFAVINVFLVYEMRDDDSELKLSPIRWTIIIMSSIVCFLIANFVVPLYLKLPFVILTLAIICQLMFKFGFIKKMFICLIAISIIWLAEAIVSFFFSLILNLNIQDLITNSYFYMIFNVLTIMFIILIIVIFKTKKFMFHINKSISIQTKNLLFFYNFVSNFKYICSIFCNC